MPAFLLAPFLTQLLIGTAIQVVGFYLLGSSSTEKPNRPANMERPTASGGIAIPIPFGDVDIASPNCIWFGDKQTVSRKVNL